MNNILFFQTQQISNSSIFHQFKEQKIFFSYFQVDQNYYLFLYAQEYIDINFIYQSIHVIEELDSKQRKIRSFRGFFLYALEIIEAGKDYEVLTTNLQPFFWKKVQNIIRQNQKGLLLEFLFGKKMDTKQDNGGSNPTIKILKDQIQTLKSQVDSLEQKISQLESKLENPKYALRGTLHAPDDRKTIQQDDYTFEAEKGPSLTENDTKQVNNVNSEIRDSTSRGNDSPSKTLLEAPRSPLKPLSVSQEYNIPSNEEKGPHGSNFITLSKISEEERVEIIQRGFQLNQQGKISLKKYYQSGEEYSLFQCKGYSIKYETIRRTKLYQQFKR